MSKAHLDAFERLDRRPSPIGCLPQVMIGNNGNRIFGFLNSKITVSTLLRHPCLTNLGANPRSLFAVHMLRILSNEGKISSIHVLALSDKTFLVKTNAPLPSACTVERTFGK
ncbi:hypothetical protein V6N13_121642 [Hibiscus sabdariffa]|uniref:Uncharacterized protein n=1 Tax=Hibiscus sabdariffa TaxID=183260 RepID=A0ABR2PDK5_9ROSI